MNYFARRDHFRETADRAVRYFREQGYKGIRTAVNDACSTMLFRATETEEREMMDIVRSRLKR